MNILGICGKVEEGDNEDYKLLTNYFASNDISDAEKTIKRTDLPDKLIYTRKDIESLLANTEKLLQKF